MMAIPTPEMMAKLMNDQKFRDSFMPHAAGLTNFWTTFGSPLGAPKPQPDDFRGVTIDGECVDMDKPKGGKR
jgi:hypothetical protein